MLGCFSERLLCVDRASDHDTGGVHRHRDVPTLQLWPHSLHWRLARQVRLCSSCATCRSFSVLLLLTSFAYVLLPLSAPACCSLLNLILPLLTFRSFLLTVSSLFADFLLNFCPVSGMDDAIVSTAAGDVGNVTLLSANATDVRSIFSKFL